MTKQIMVGGVAVGGGAPVTIQSMCNTKTEDAGATIEQILRLEQAGCEIVRVTVPTPEAAEAVEIIKNSIHIPLVADIHFDHHLAIMAAENGISKLRINPGNIGGENNVRELAACAKLHHIPIRIGVNSGSIEKDILQKYGGPTVQALVESAAENVRLLEKMNFYDIVVSLKASELNKCADAYLTFAEEFAYPLHLGITEAGTIISGNIKSSIGLGLILNQGIGDTIRVSLTGDPLEEIKSAKLILRTLGLRKGGIEVVSCPTCGRTRINLIELANQVENMVADIPLDIKVAVMGCVVNGPGEAREADIGIAGGVGEGLIIKHGQIDRKVPENQLLSELRKELLNWNKE